MSVVESITDPIYVDETGNRINCFVKFDTISVPVPFTADKNDIEPHGVAIYEALVGGQYGPVAAYVPPPPPPTQAGPNVIA